MRTTVSAPLAALILGLEGIGLLVLTATMTTGLLAGDAGDLGSGIALVLMTLIGAAALFAFAVAVVRGQSWGRSGGVVAQLLIIAVAVGAMTGAYAHPLTGVALAVPAVLTLVLLFFASRAAAPPREPAPSGE